MISEKYVLSSCLWLFVPSELISWQKTGQIYSFCQALRRMASITGRCCQHTILTQHKSLPYDLYPQAPVCLVFQLLFSLSLSSFYSLTLVLFRGTLVCDSVGTGLSIQSHNKVLRRATERTRWLASETFFAHTHTHTLLSQGPSLGLLYPRVTSRHHVTDRNNSNGYTRKMTLTVICI